MNYSAKVKIFNRCRHHADFAITLLNYRNNSAWTILGGSAPSRLHLRYGSVINPVTPGSGGGGKSAGSGGSHVHINAAQVCSFIYSS